MNDETLECRECVWCDGWGKIRRHHGKFDCYHDCPTCGGSGLLVSLDGEWVAYDVIEHGIWYEVPEIEEDDNDED